MSSYSRSHARSMVLSCYGIAATSHVLASEAAAEVLARGGSAADAAITANAVLGVTEPMTNGMGGDLFVLYWQAKKRRLHGLNASGWAPAGLSIEQLRRKGFTAMPRDGIHSVTVPGVVGGWGMLHRHFGQRRWKELFQPAIFCAEKGYPVPEVIHAYWQVAHEALAQDKEALRVCLPEGKVPAVGSIFRNPDLAKSLRMVAEDGPNAFYRGKIARAIISTSDAFGGTLSSNDLEDYSAEWANPISTSYRGWTVYELPPNGQGMAALEMLNIMETQPASPDGPLSVRELHKKIEAMKLAYADLARYNADPRFTRVPVKGLISKKYAKQRARLMSPRRAGKFSFGIPPGSDTTYLAVVDREGNIASLIQSNYIGFGSGIMVRGMGFMLQSRGALFSLDPSHPNALAPRKRPFHTIIPAFMERGERHVGFGIMGGANQALAHAQFVSNVVDYGMNVQAALELARFTVGERMGTGGILLESRVSREVAQELAEMGHELQSVGDFCLAMGRGQAVQHDAKAKVNYGASDPRSDGAAAPEPLPVKW